MSIIHKNLSQGRWHTLTLAEQLGNVGSEYERAVHWKEKDHQEYFERAFARTLELLDLTLTDPRWGYHRLRELARVREEVCREFNTSTQQGGLQKYFFQFAAKARR